MQQENKTKQDNEVTFSEVLLIMCRQLAPLDKLLLWQEENQRNKELREEDEKQRICAEETARAIYESMKKDARMEQYHQLRKEVELMPQYKHWRQSVIEKFGRKCSVCGSTENIEVDHRYKSFHSIVRSYGITNTVQAYECSALWEVNNGAPLCKTHHDQTKSSMYRNSKL